MLASFAGSFLEFLPVVLPRWIGAWLIAFLALVYSFSWLKPRVRRRAFRLDDKVRKWSKELRYRGLDTPDERKKLTWFFRFWTNFSCSPALAAFSILLPFWRYCMTSPPGMDDQLVPYKIAILHCWMLPGFCFSGGMLQSFLLKRIFRRLRPPREMGAFGHKLKDASFPSGHSLTSLCFWSMVVVSLSATGAPAYAIAAAAAWSVWVVACTGMSRIYLGVHFPSDVVGGYIIGAVWSVCCYVALRPLM